MVNDPSRGAARISIGAWLLAALLVFWAAWPFLVRLPRLGPGQANDYYPTIGLVADGTEWSTRVLDWLAVRSNEHCVIVPNAIYAVNAELFAGDNRALGAWSILMMAITALALVSLLPRGESGGRGGGRSGADLAAWLPPFCLASLVIAAFAVTPKAAHNVALGFSGTMWLTANALAASALALVHLSARLAGRGAERFGAWAFRAALALATIASVTYTTGHVAWAALALLLVTQGDGDGRPRFGSLRRVGITLVLGGLVVAAAMAKSGTPKNHPDLNTGQDSGLLVQYLETYLGGLFGDTAPSAQAWGLVGLGLAVLVHLGLPLLLDARRRRLYLAPWRPVLVLGLANALGTSVGRSGFGTEQALSSRYATLAAFFWIGVLVPLILVSWDLLHRHVRGRARRAALGLLGAAVVVSWIVPSRTQGVDLLDRFVERASAHRTALAAFAHGVPDDQLFRHALTLRPDQMWEIRDFLEAQGQIPFDGSVPPWPEGTLEDIGRIDNLGYLDSLAPAAEGWVRLRGWTLHPTTPVADIVFTDADLRLLGRAAYGIHRPDVADEIGPGAAFSGFMGHVDATAIETLPRTFVRLEDDPTYYELVPLDEMRAHWAVVREMSLATQSPYSD